MAETIPGPVINRIPPGVLSQLGIKSGGRNPEILNSVLNGCVDLWPLYMHATAEIVGDTTSVNGVGVWGTSTLIAGQDEWWWVHEYSIATPTLAATQTAQFAPALTWNGQSAILGIIGRLASSGERSSAFAERQFLLPPGAGLGGQMAVQANGPLNMTGVAKFTRLKV